MLWRGLSAPDEQVFWMTADFVSDRLCERATLDWALALPARCEAERRAVVHVLQELEDRQTPLEEPWRTGWSLLETSWSTSSGETYEGGAAAYSICKRVESGQRLRELTESIVKLVEPRLEVEPATWWSGRKRGRPKKFTDLVRASVTSGHVVQASELGLPTVTDGDFLWELASALDAALRRGLALGRSVGWDGDDQLWRLGSLSRVHEGSHREGNEDADFVHRGIAPVTKLLCATALRLAEVAPGKLAPLLLAWRASGTTVDLRLWAALAQRKDIVAAADVTKFLAGVDDTRFWDIHLHPEIALLRARRYAELDSSARRDVAKRLRRRPPRNMWRRRGDLKQVDKARDYWGARELKRIVVCGGVLPGREQAWLDEQLARFEDLRTMDLEAGFLGKGIRIVAAPSVDPDPAFEGMRGDALLRALERMLSEPEDSAQAREGRVWLGGSEQMSAVVRHLAESSGGAAVYPKLRVWLWRFHRSAEDPVGDAKDAAAMLEVLTALSDADVAEAAGGVSEWMGRWCRTIAKIGAWANVWLKAWPGAVEATNAIYQPEDAGRLNVTVEEVGGDEKEPGDGDARSTPVASLIDVFLGACPDEVKQGDPNPFEDSALGKMRDALVACDGQALLIVRHRLLGELGYFLQADRSWAEGNLIAPLYSDEAGRLALWRAVAGANLREKALRMIGEEVAREAANPDLGHRTRTSLVFSLVVESLFALLENREPAVDAARVQQVLRTVDDEIRGEAADTVVRFVREVSRGPYSSADVYERAAAPFLRDVWPLERTLASRGASRAFAKLPARVGRAFADAVEAIERFLVPFACHSLTDYGLYGNDGDGVPKLHVVDDERKALALLRLLDRTVGTSPGSVVPFELRDALERIRTVRGDLAERTEFRRLRSMASL